MHMWVLTVSKHNIIVHVDEKKQTVKALKVHETTKKEFYYKQRNGRDYQNIFVKESDVYCIDRYYRQNKSFPNLRRLIVRIKAKSKKNYENYMCVVYSLTDTLDEDEERDVEILPHGNSKVDEVRQKPYHKTAKRTLQAQEDMLYYGKDANEVYDEVLDNCGGHLGSKSQAEEPRNVKQVHNRMYKIKRQNKTENSSNEQKLQDDDILQIIEAQKTYEMIQTVVSTRSAYFFFLVSEKQINDFKKFCCTNAQANTVLAVDTTFNLCDL